MENANQNVNEQRGGPIEQQRRPYPLYPGGRIPYHEAPVAQMHVPWEEARPRPLTIEEYRARQSREEVEPRKKKRGGCQLALRKEINKYKQLMDIAVTPEARETYEKLLELTKKLVKQQRKERKINKKINENNYST